MGFLGASSSVESAGDPKTAEFKHKWVVDQAIGYIPVGGDEIQAGVDYVTDKWLADEQKKLDEKAADKNSRPLQGPE